jgi:hypothetical protein
MNFLVAADRLLLHAKITSALPESLSISALQNDLLLLNVNITILASKTQLLFGRLRLLCPDVTPPQQCFDIPHNDLKSMLLSAEHVSSQH